MWLCPKRDTPIGVLVVAYAAGLAGLAALPVLRATGVRLTQ
jgi:hypothetical protein